MAGPHDQAHGMFERERQIMDMNDRGLNARQIADELHLGATYIRQVIGRYHFGKLAQEMSAIEKATRDATRHFQRALEASGGRFA